MDEWSVDNLRQHFDALRAEEERRYEQRFLAQERAVAAALANAEKTADRLEDQAAAWRANANEWRAAMTDREQRFVTREAFDAQAAVLAALAIRFEKTEGRGLGRAEIVGLVFATATFVGAVVGVIAAATG
jgi:hypothetical protein